MCTAGAVQVQRSTCPVLPTNSFPIDNGCQRAFGLLRDDVASFDGRFGCNLVSAPAAATCVTAEPASVSKPTYVADAADMAEAISHFISSEMVNLVEVS
jgi:hypothetical protein